MREPIVRINNEPVEVEATWDAGEIVTVLVRAAVLGWLVGSLLT